MKKLIEAIHLLSPINCELNTLFSESYIQPFDNKIVEFIQSLSKQLMKDSKSKDYPEILALAFWMRKSNIYKLKKIFEDKNSKTKLLLPKGIVFHIAPANVDSIFIYSWFISMLCGNLNIVKVSSKQSVVLQILLEHINSLLEKDFKELKRYFRILKYDNQEFVTRYLSQKADMRVLWGGDSTIDKIRKIALKPYAVDLVFADKFSYTLIKSQKFIEENNKEDLLNKFYNDVFFFDQNACSSPRMILWLGEEDVNQEARDIFWEEFEKILSHKEPDINASVVMKKFVAQYVVASKVKIADIKNIQGNKINSLLVKDIKELSRESHCGGGLFYEKFISELDELGPLVERKDQTLSVFGFENEEIKDFLFKNIPKGIDRVVPIGNALDFSSNWDSIDLFESFSRKVEITI